MSIFKLFFCIGVQFKKLIILFHVVSVSFILVGQTASHNKEQKCNALFMTIFIYLYRTEASYEWHIGKLN